MDRTDPPLPLPLAVAAVLTVAAVLLLLGAATLTRRARRAAPRDPGTGLLTRQGLLAVAPSASWSHPVAVLAVRTGLRDASAAALGGAAPDDAGGECAAAAARDGVTEACAGRPHVLARLGEDTLAVVLTGPDSDDVLALADAIRDRLAGPAVVDGVVLEPTAAVGLARGPGAVEVLLGRAQDALAVALAEGPSVLEHDEALAERAHRRVAIVRGFAPALDEGQLDVHFQPTVSLGERTVLGVEALARWDHPELGALLPDEFVPVLEAAGRTGALTTFVLDAALAAARRWLDRGMRLSVAVNVPVGLLSDPRFPDRVGAALAAHAVPAELLTLELTESGVSGDRVTALPVLRRLRELGCRIAVDDFGTGQSSLAHLRSLPVDQVKIDKSFVLAMDDQRGGAAMVRAIVEMGHTLGLTVVAEGVERPTVRTALAEMGCDVAQGYLLSRPLPAGGLDRWFASLDARPHEGGPRTLLAWGAV